MLACRAGSANSINLLRSSCCSCRISRKGFQFDSVASNDFYVEEPFEKGPETLHPMPILE